MTVSTEMSKIHQPAPQGGQKASPDLLLVAYLYMIQSMQITNVTSQIQEKMAASTASAQNQLIAEQRNENFITFANGKLLSKELVATVFEGLPGDGVWVTMTLTEKQVSQFEGADNGNDVRNIHTKTFVKKSITNTSLELLMNQNEEIQAVRGVIGNQIGIINQDGSLQATNINSTVDISQQTVTQAISFMQLLSQLSSYITRI